MDQISTAYTLHPVITHTIGRFTTGAAVSLKRELLALGRWADGNKIADFILSDICACNNILHINEIVETSSHVGYHMAEFQEKISFFDEDLDAASVTDQKKQINDHDFEALLMGAE